MFGMLIDIWSERLDSMVDLQQRKMTGLAIAALLPVKDE